MNTTTNDMSNRIRVGILHRQDNLCYRGQRVKKSSFPMAVF